MINEYVVLIGRGRSGTSWMAGIMNTYYHCVYKYEPYLKIPYRGWFDSLNKPDAEKLRAQFEKLCLQCHHGVDMPPFLPKSFRPQNPILLHALYALANRVKRCKGLYEYYGKPRLNHAKHEISVLIKQVNFPSEKLPDFCRILKPKIVGLVRNPFANVASHLVGVKGHLFKGVRPKSPQPDLEKGKAKSLRAKINGLLREEIVQSGNKSFLKYSDGLEKMNLQTFGAVAWRIHVEPMVEFIENYDNGLLIVYEDMCRDPLGVSKRIFDFAGWEMTEFTKDYIKKTTTEKKIHRSTLKSYYSIFKDPRKSMNKWKTQLSDEEKRDIALVIKDSPLKKFWPDLPL